MSNVCKNCGEEYDGDNCPKCSTSTEESQQADVLNGALEPTVENSSEELFSENENIDLSDSTQEVPLQENSKVNSENNFDSQHDIPKEKFYKKTWFIIVMIVIFFPIGLFLMWKYKKFNKNIRIAVSCVVGVIFIAKVASTGPSQAEYDELLTKYDKQADELLDLNDDFDDITKEYKDYKEKMKPYEQMELAEAEAKKIEAERVAAEKKAADEKKAAAAAAAKAEEEARGYETGISYDQLARTPDDFKGQKVKFYGKVIQVMEDTSSTQIRLAVDDNYDTVLFAEYLPSIVQSRVLEDDYITIYGSSVGTISYKSTLGGTITIPGIYVDKIDQ